VTVRQSLRFGVAFSDEKSSSLHRLCVCVCVCVRARVCVRVGTGYLRLRLHKSATAAPPDLELGSTAPLEAEGLAAM
jgi:hypothetical protein